MNKREAKKFLSNLIDSKKDDPIFQLIVKNNDHQYICRRVIEILESSNNLPLAIQLLVYSAMAQND